VDGGSPKTEENKVITTSKQDESGVYVVNNGNLTLINPKITTSGDTSNMNASSFYGLNAVLLANEGGNLTVKGGTISSTGSGANGAMAVQEDAVINLSDLTIKATGGGGHAVMATGGGTINCTNVDMDTTGRSGAPIALDRGGGTVTVTGGKMTSSGQGSPILYSTGILTVKDITGTAIGSEAVVIEGKNTVKVTDSFIRGEVKCGVMIYQSMSGDAKIGVADFTMSGGALEAAVGPLFFINNTTADVKLTEVKLLAESGILIQAKADRWGTSGKNGGNMILTADKQTMDGDIEVDEISTAKITLQNSSTLTGAIDSANTGKEVDLTLDSTSKWNVTGDSYLNSLSNKDGISGTSITNITGNGHTVYYDKGASKDLGGKTYTLNGGGSLKPAD
jgi:hypothetical protein